MAGRLTLAIVLSAQEDNDGIAQEQATRVLEACLTLLKHFSLAFPISLGAAETLKETCRGAFTGRLVIGSRADKPPLS